MSGILLGLAIALVWAGVLIGLINRKAMPPACQVCHGRGKGVAGYCQTCNGTGHT